MGLIKPKPQPSVPGERLASGVQLTALAVAGLAMLAIVGLLWVWLTSIAADHLSGPIGACIVIVMGALGVAAVAFGIWAVLQHPWFKERARRRAG